MSGTIPLSLTQQFDIYGKPLKGGQLFLIQAGTVATPQNGFQDSALTIPLPNPVPLDAAGRIPQFFLADGLIKVRLVDKGGVVQLTADSILVIGPSAGGGGAPSVDPTTILQTGWLQPIYGTGVIAGFVRANGRMIGGAASGASERANADCQALFQYLWAADPNLPVSAGRGASANADWVANKQLTLPDWRGRNIAGLDDMGNVPAGAIPSIYYGGTNATVLGAGNGGAGQLLSAANLPPHTHSGRTGDDSPDHSHGYDRGAVQLAGSGLAADVTRSLLYTVTQSTGASTRHQHNFTTDLGPGAGAGFSVMNPSRLATIYIKL